MRKKKTTTRKNGIFFSTQDTAIGSCASKGDTQYLHIQLK